MSVVKAVDGHRRIEFSFKNLSQPNHEEEVKSETGSRRPREFDFRL